MANVKDLLVNGSARVIGTIYGNATSADKVNHSLTFGSKSFNGSSAQTITLADLGGKPTQSAVSSPSASGTEISFIDTISQNANGVITATKKTVRDASASQSGVINTGAQTFAGNKTFTGQLIKNGVSSSWVSGRDNALLRMVSIGGYSPAISIKTTNGSWDIGAYNHSSFTDDLIFSYVTDADYNANNNTTTSKIKFLENGHIVASLDGNASTADNADKLDKKHANEFMYYGGDDINLGNSSPASTAKTYFTDNTKTPLGMMKGYYNSNGREYSQLYSRSTGGDYGSILRWGYNDKYLYILRYNGGTWQSDDWEKISAGNADTATKLATARNITIGNKTNSFNGSADIKYNLQNILICAGNEFNYTADGISGLWFNFKTQTRTDATTKITDYYFGNGRGSTSGVTIHASNFSGNAATATKLATARTISLTGSVTGSGTFDGSGNLSIATMTNHNHDSNYLQYSGWWDSSSGQHVNSATGMVFAYGSHGLPGSWGVVTTFEASKGSNYRHQIYGDGLNNEMYFRTCSSDTGGWHAWRHLLDSSNYTSYTVTKTGSGASGTWGINISGNAAGLNYYSIDNNLTVAQAKNQIRSKLTNKGIAAVVLGSSYIDQWNTDTASYYESSVHSMIALNPGYDNTTYGHFLVAHYGDRDLCHIGVDGNNWGRLRTLLDSANYTYYTVTKTGDGASGTWGISISGNASSASKVNNKLTVGSKTYDGSAAVTISASDLGLSSAMLFLGTTTTAITDGAKTNPVAIGGSNKTVTAGNVVLYGSKEFVWTGSAWEELGNEGSYKIVQSAVGDPSASGTSNTFIATISQDANGKITATKKTVAVTNSAPTLAWGTTSTIGSVAGTNLQVTMPANPNTWRGIQNNLTSDSTTDSLSAAQGKVLKGLIDGKAPSSHTHNYAGSSSAGGSANSAIKLDTSAGSSSQPVYFSDGKPIAITGTIANNISGNAATATIAGTRWSSIIAGNTWSRICLLTPTASGVSGFSGLLHVNWTRGNVVANASFIINCSHTTGYSHIVQLNSNSYSSFQIRLVTDSSSLSYVELYDNAFSIATGTQQAVLCSWIPFGYVDITAYTTFTTGATIPNGFAASSTKTIKTGGAIVANAVYGAVWNDYAEYRKSTELEPGRCVIEVGDGSLIRSFGRLEPGAEIVSDTFGFAIGETDECKTPLAVSGRVLAYPAEDRESYKPGDAVCSGPNGTVSKMTRQEIREWPDRIIGTVSEIPNYETWGTGNVQVNGRIWIRIR